VAIIGYGQSEHLRTGSERPDRGPEGVAFQSAAMLTPSRPAAMHYPQNSRNHSTNKRAPSSIGDPD
jgi:hypothetical protein